MDVKWWKNSTWPLVGLANNGVDEYIYVPIINVSEHIYPPTINGIFSALHVIALMSKLPKNKKNKRYARFIRKAEKFHKVNWKNTYNTTAKNEMPKIINRTPLNWTLKLEQYEHYENRCSDKVNISCSINDIRRATL